MRFVLHHPSEGFDESKVITNHNPIDNKTKKFTEDGLFSSKIFGSNDGQADVYCCDCGEMKGKFLLGETCSECNTKVRLRSNNVTSVGWIDLGDFFIINPIHYYHMKKIIGGTTLDTILCYTPKLSKDGLVEEMWNPADTPYASIGIPGLREKFWEVLDYYKGLKTSESAQEGYDFIKEYEDFMWVSKIPVYSSLLRPAMLIGKKLNFAEENVLFSTLVKLAEMLKKKKNLERNNLTVYPILFELQENYNLLAEKIISIFSGKHGFYRENLLGNRVNFSGRMVISPQDIFENLKLNEIQIPYLAALEIYKFEIIKVLSQSMPYKDAEIKWKDAQLDYDETIYAIMEQLVERTKGRLACILNRNPTIDFGSIQSVDVAKIKKNYSDYTISVPNNFLALFNADYD